MEKITINTSQNVTIEYELASVGERIVAYIFDLLVGVSYMVLVYILIGTTDRYTGSNLGQSSALLVLIYLPFFLYELICETLMNGQTFGKKLMTIKVVRLDGGAPAFSHYLFRWIIRLFEVSMTGGIVALISILIGGKGQRIGDMAANTCVVRIKRRMNIRSLSLGSNAQPDAYEASFPQVLQLNDRDMRILREVLQTYRRSTNPEIIALSAAQVKEKLGLESDMNDYKFIETVVRDYNWLTSESSTQS